MDKKINLKEVVLEEEEYLRLFAELENMEKVMDSKLIIKEINRFSYSTPTIFYQYFTDDELSKELIHYQSKLRDAEENEREIRYKYNEWQNSHKGFWKRLKWAIFNK